MKAFADFGIRVSATTGEVDTTCPECSPSRKKKTDRCLSVNVDRGTWICHHCGWAGGLGGEKTQFPKKTFVRPKFEPQPISEAGISFCSERGITPEVLKRNHVSVGAIRFADSDKPVPVLQFPYYRGDEVINIKHRTRDKRFRMEKDAERCLYGLNDIAETTIIVEGEFDKLALEVAGFPNCVSVPDGAPSPNTKNYASKFEFLDADADRLLAVNEWIIAVDNDEAGKRLEDELARRLGREKCKRVLWPDGCKDANDVLLNHSPYVLGQCIQAAIQYPIEGVFTVADLSDKLQRLYEHGWEKGVSTGWEPLDEFYTVRPGELTIVTGVPNSGKSNFIDALLVNLAKLHGWNFGMFSPENQPVEDHIARVIEKWAGMPFHAGPSQRMPKQTLSIGRDWVNDHFSWILPGDDSTWTIDNLLEIAKALVYRKGIQGLVIDPWNELEHQRGRDMTETEHVSRSLKRIRQFGRQHGVHVWVVAHPSKLIRDKTGEYPVPTMYDISGSAHWRNKADNGICVWRDISDSDSQIVDIHVQKIRFRQIGRVGMCSLAHNRITGTYHALERAADEIPPVYMYGE